MSNSTPDDHITHALELAARARAFTVFDLETTDKMESIHRDGGPHDGTPTGKVMQLAARRYAWDPAAGRGRLTHELSVLVNDPDILQCCLADKAYETHLIAIEDLRGPGSNARLRGAMRLSPTETWRAFISIVSADGGSVLMGQNIIRFDIPFANRELARIGARPVLDAELAIDTLLITRGIYHLSNNRLRTIADHLGVRTDPALDHDALGDIDTCYAVWERLYPAAREFATRRGTDAADPYAGRLGALGSAWSPAEAQAQLAGIEPEVGPPGDPRRPRRTPAVVEAA